MSEPRRLFRDQAYVRRGRTEPIDGLLRISAPHEWLFFALLGCALIGLLAWAVFANIERGLSAPCAFVSATGDIHASARLPSEDARRVTVGMSARVGVPGAAGALDGRVVQVAHFGAGSDSGRPLVVVRLSEAPATSLSEGRACNLRIITSRESPISLIVPAAAVVPSSLD